MRDIPLEECEVTLTAKLNVRGLLGVNSDETIFPGFSSIHYETNISSSADKLVLDKLIHDVEQQCPVMDMLTRSVKIEGEAKINGINVHEDNQKTSTNVSFFKKIFNLFFKS